VDGDLGGMNAGELPADSLILIIGPAGCGKSTWAARHFDAREILSSDAFREMVSGDAADQSASRDAFHLLHLAARARLRRGLRTVIDATNLTARARRPLLGLAHAAGRPAVAIVFDVALDVCLARNEARTGRRVSADIVRRHHAEMPLVRAQLPEEGYASIIVVGEDGRVVARLS
jgi:predicted kinase